jgi:hypothetical protein
LYINSDAEFPKLSSVGGDLYIRSNAEFSAPKLTSVGGYLSINSDAEFPKLSSVGGDLYIHSNVKFSAPKLTSVGGDKPLYPLIRDTRGYVGIIYKKDGVLIIKSGCHNFNFTEAKKHWGEKYHGDRTIGDMYLNAIEKAEKRTI